MDFQSLKESRWRLVQKSIFRISSTISFLCYHGNVQVWLNRQLSKGWTLQIVTTSAGTERIR